MPVLIAIVILVTRHYKDYDTGTKGYDARCIQENQSSLAAGSLVCSIETSQNAETGKPHPQWWDKLLSWPEGITAWAVLLTLYAIVWQAWETRKAAEAAVAQVANAEKTSKQQLRAYLGIAESVARFNMGVGLVTELHVSNSGQTPAYDVTMWSHASVRSYPHGDPVPPPPGGPPKSVSILSPQGTPFLMNSNPVPITPEIAQAISTPNTAYFVQGQIRYLDIFKDVHVLNYRLFFGGAGHSEVIELKDGSAVGRLMMDGKGNYEE